jgi:hypothetical protein
MASKILGCELCRSLGSGTCKTSLFRTYYQKIIEINQMGCCCSKYSIDKHAFHQDLGKSLLDNKSPTVDKNTRFMIVRLDALKNITYPANFRKPNAFVQMRLIPEDSEGNKQEQHSTIVPATTNPLWVSKKKYHMLFFSSDYLLCR